jgi:integrase
VHRKLTKLQAETMSGKRIPSTSQTVGEYLTYWLHEIARHRVRETTYQSYEWLTLNYLIPLFGKKRLAKLQPSDIRRGFHQLKQTCQCCAQGKDLNREARAQQARAKRSGKTTKNARPIEGARCCAKKPPECCRSVVSDGTIRYLHRLLRAALQDAVSEEGLLTDNVAKNLRLQHRYRPKFTPWTGTEARHFLKAARDDRLYALYAVALSLGLRRGEALALRWSDIDLDTGVIRVRNALHRTTGGLEIGPVKTDGSARTVALPPPCSEALRDHRAHQEAERAAAGLRWRDRGLVFTTTLGTPLEPRNLNRHLDRLCERAGVRRIRFHDLRHSCASLLYEQGVPIENIQDVLGHSSPTVTKMIYVEVTDRIQRDAVNRLGYLFDEGPDE